MKLCNRNTHLWFISTSSLRLLRDTAVENRAKMALNVISSLAFMESIFIHLDYQINGLTLLP